MASLRAYRFLTVRQVDETPDTLTVSLSTPGWTFLACVAALIGGVLICLVWGSGPLGFLGWIVGLVLAGMALWGLYDLLGGRVQISFDKRAGMMTVQHWRWQDRVPLSDVRRVIVARVDKHRQKHPFQYELLLEQASGEVQPLTREAGAPVEYEREPYDALARRIHDFLGLTEPVDYRDTTGWPETRPLTPA